MHINHLLKSLTLTIPPTICSSHSRSLYHLPSTEVTQPHSALLPSTQVTHLYPDKPGKWAQCIPIYDTILGQRTRNRANAGPIFLVCRDCTNYRLLRSRTPIRQIYHLLSSSTLTMHIYHLLSPFTLPCISTLYSAHSPSLCTSTIYSASPPLVRKSHKKYPTLTSHIWQCREALPVTTVQWWCSALMEQCSTKQWQWKRW